MNVNNNLQTLQQLFSSQEVARSSDSSKTSGAGETQQQGGADRTTLSTAGGLAAAAASDSDVRMEKVSVIQQALAAGTYNIPASEVAGKMIDHMLGR